ncbi:hypothetical protein H7992_09295 [Sporosarcina sp. resist]|uniref:hypothetical protein n=1 Tax=Sporosarcina sp. resist TaxID=2762563 RepID=UPI00164DCA68|nr:hypothetical protein [Sporosarcina sp. resist]QNK89821.1 hypothetical protein H7992_09295 [Sporosarcina sp. resist]
MLPEILKVAEEYGLSFNPRSHGKKETLCKCCFCAEDSKAGKGHKFYLSLNTHDQLFKCWFCGVSGGVLDFEAKISGLPYSEIRKKYFGIRKKPIHPAESLNAHQLRSIGWAEYKRENRAAFKENREMVFSDWQNYEYEELAKHFAMFIVVAHIENQEERQNNLLHYVMQSCHDTQIQLMFNRVLAEYVKDEADRAGWAIQGAEIGRAAWKVSLSTYDFEMDKVVYNVIFLYHMLKTDEMQKSLKGTRKKEAIVNDKMSFAN